MTDYSNLSDDELVDLYNRSVAVDAQGADAQGADAQGADADVDYGGMSDDDLIAAYREALAQEQAGAQDAMLVRPDAAGESPAAPAAVRRPPRGKVSTNAEILARMGTEQGSPFWAGVKGAVAGAAEGAAKGGAKALKEVGKGVVGMGTGALRLAGTPVRALGWDGIHRLADAVDAGYENFGADALDLGYEDALTKVGDFGGKVVGVAGSLAALGGAGKAVGAAGAALKASGHARAAQAAAAALPLMFGNNAAVQTYDTAKRTAEARGEDFDGTPAELRALGLASVSGAIHFFGFKAFENQSLSRLLGMPQTMEASMPSFLNAARKEGSGGFSGLVRGVRNGMIRYTLAERAKGALKAGGIMAAQEMLSDIPMQMAEGAEDIDWGRFAAKGLHGAGEGALMEGLMGAAAVLKSPKSARDFVTDAVYVNGYKVVTTSGGTRKIPGLLTTRMGRAFLAKQAPDALNRVTDIVEHGGRVTAAEKDAACLPPDLTDGQMRWLVERYAEDAAGRAPASTRIPQGTDGLERRTARQNAAALETAQRAANDAQGRADAEATARELKRGYMTDEERLRLEESYPRPEPEPEPAREPAPEPKPEPEPELEPQQEAPHETGAEPHEEQPPAGTHDEEVPDGGGEPPRTEEAAPVAETGGEPPPPERPVAPAPEPPPTPATKKKRGRPALSPEERLGRAVAKVDSGRIGDLSNEELELLHNSEGWHTRLNVKGKKAEAVRDAVEEKYEDAYLYRHGEKDGETGKSVRENTGWRSALLHFRKWRENPDDLDALAFAYKAVGDAEMSERGKDGGDPFARDVFARRFRRVLERMGALSPAGAKQVADKVSAIEAKRSPMERKRTQQYTETARRTDEEPEQIDLSDANSARRFERLAEQDQAETPNDAAAESADHNPFKGYEIEIKGVDGDRVELAYYDRNGNFLRSDAKTVDELRRYGAVEPKFKELVKAVEARGEDAEGASIRFARRTDAAPAKAWTPETRRAAEGVVKTLDGFIKGVKARISDAPHAGGAVCTYDPESGELVLHPGARVQDAVHEFVHPLWQFAEREAAAGRTTLRNALIRIRDSAPEAVRKAVGEAYADRPDAEILEEILTHEMGRQGESIFGKALATLEGRAWYTRAWNAIKELYRGFMRSIGRYDARLDRLNGIPPQEAARHILSEMANGRRFGELSFARDGASAIREARGVDIPSVPSGDDIRDFLDGRDDWKRDLRRKFQDKNIGIREVEERLGVTDKAKSAYYAKDFAFGKNEHELTHLQKQEVAPVIEKIHKSGGSLELFSKYLYARHAGERNAVLKTREGVENGSGMDEERIKSIFDEVDRLGLRAAFEDAAKDVWAMNRKYLQRRVDSGRMTQDECDFLLNQYKRYVPLRTDMTDAELEAVNSTTGGWRRNELRAARGRASEADDPLAFSIVQNEQAIRASNANEVRRAWAEIVRKSIEAGAPLGEIVEGRQAGTAKWTFDFGGGDRVEVGSGLKLADGRDDVILFKENGVLKAVRMAKGEHGRGLELARAVTDRDVVQFNRYLEWIPRMTRAMSAMRTQYVPTFIVRNLKADNLEVLLNVLSERGLRGKDGGAAFFGRFLKNEVSVAKGVKEYFKTGRSSDAFVQEAVENGLLTGGGMAAEGFTETAARLSESLQAMRERPNALGRAWNGAKDLVSLLNACAEYNTRMGVYKTLRQEGVSVADAVSYARDVTVNFNRKGYLTPYSNAAFMFSNAAVQGMGRAFRSMGSERGREVLAGLFMVGVAEALLDEWIGQDDEREKAGGANARNVSEYDKSHSLGVALPTGHRVKWQIRNPWALPMYAGRKAVELVKGISSGEKVLKDLAGEVGAFVTEPVGGNGFGSTAECLQTLAPTLVDPFVQWATGKDYKGEDRVKRNFDRHAPDSWNGKDRTPEMYKAVAKALNFVSGGNANRKGALDTSPENWQLLAETVFGGLLTDLGNFAKAGGHVIDAARGRPADAVVRDVPFVRDTFTNIPDNTGRYYDAVDAYAADKAEYKKTTDMKRRAALRKDKSYLSSKKVALDAMIDEISDCRRRERGEVKRNGKWVNPGRDVPADVVAQLRKKRLRLQARVLRILGK